MLLLIGVSLLYHGGTTHTDSVTGWVDKGDVISVHSGIVVISIREENPDNYNSMDETRGHCAKGKKRLSQKDKYRDILLRTALGPHSGGS